MKNLLLNFYLFMNIILPFLLWTVMFIHLNEEGKKMNGEQFWILTVLSLGSWAAAYFVIKVKQFNK